MNLYCKKANPSILIASETHTTDHEDKELKIDNYIINRCNSHSKFTGGVAIYVRNDLKFDNVKITATPMTWILSLDLVENGKMTVIGIYKSPKEVPATFLKNLKMHITQYVKPDHKIICIGDININVAKKSAPMVVDYINVLSSFGLKQIMNDYTRIGRSRTIIDHVITNINGIKYNVNDKFCISDHLVIEVFMNKLTMKKNIEKQRYKCMINYSKESFLDKLMTHNLDVGCSLDETIEAISKTTNEFVVEKTECKPKSKFWFTEKLAELKRKKNELYLKYKIENCNVTYKEFVTISKEYKNQLKNAHSAAIQKELEENRNDSKKLWKILKGLYKDDENHVIKIEINNEIISDPIVTANEMNNYFLDSINEIVSKIPEPKLRNYLDRIKTPCESFVFDEVTMSELKDTVKYLKN